MHGSSWGPVEGAAVRRLRRIVAPARRCARLPGAGEAAWRSAPCPPRLSMRSGPRRSRPPLRWRRVFSMKGRPSRTWPFRCCVPSWDHVESLVVVPRGLSRSSRRGHGQAPLTAIMRCVGAACRRSLPGHPGRSHSGSRTSCCSLLDIVGPLTGTSANRHGEDPSHRGRRSPRVVAREAPELVLDGGLTIRRRREHGSGPHPTTLRGWFGAVPSPES